MSIFIDTKHLKSFVIIGILLCVLAAPVIIGAFPPFGAAKEFLASAQRDLASSSRVELAAVAPFSWDLVCLSRAPEGLGHAGIPNTTHSQRAFLNLRPVVLVFFEGGQIVKSYGFRSREYLIIDNRKYLFGQFMGDSGGHSCAHRNEAEMGKVILRNNQPGITLVKKDI